MSTPQPPVIRPPTPGKCSAGTTPCGQPARFYAAGWLCPQHSPATQRNQ